MMRVFWTLALLILTPAHADEVRPRTIEVLGTGTLSREPDQARISFGVETQARTAKEAAAANAAQTTRLMKALKDHGIRAGDLRTRHYRLSPRYRTDDRDRPTLETIGFNADNTVEVVERRLTEIGALIDVAVEAGANRIGGIGFELSEPQVARREALAAAVNAAQLNAGVIARASGQKLGPIVEILSRGGSPGPRMERALAMSARADTPIEAGSLQISASVVVRFSIEE